MGLESMSVTNVCILKMLQMAMSLCVCIVRLNLINHVLALFRDIFACNTALRTLYLGGNHVRLVCERV